MSSPTDTNQASEDELAKQIESITQAMFVTLSEWQAGVPIDWHSAKVKGRADLLALVRTEKLKLLAEVREQTTIFKIKAHDKKGQPHLYEAGRGVPTEVLTKLEAEL